MGVKKILHLIDELNKVSRDEGTYYLKYSHPEYWYVRGNKYSLMSVDHGYHVQTFKTCNYNQLYQMANIIKTLISVAQKEKMQ